jgi:hypothetical protein
VNFSSGQTSNRHWLGGGHRSLPAPRILASVRPGRARDSFSTLGEPTKGFRPHRSPSLVRLRAAQGLDARHHAASAATMFPGRRVLRDSSMSGARWWTASVFGRLLMPPSHSIALRKEAADVACEAQAERVRNGAPARCGLFEFHSRCRASVRERGCSRASGKDLGGERSPGRIGRPPTGNGRMASRTRRRSKASKPALPSSGSLRVDSGNGGDRRRRAGREGTARGQRPR